MTAHDWAKSRRVGSFRILQRSAAESLCEQRPVAVRLSGCDLIAAARWTVDGGKRRAEVALFDSSLNPIARDNWPGAGWDAAVIEADGDRALLAAVGAYGENDGKQAVPCLRLYEIAPDRLALRDSITWRCDDAEWGVARAAAAVQAVDGSGEIAVLTLAGGPKDGPGHAEIRLYGADLSLRGHADRQLEPGRIDRDSDAHLAVLPSRRSGPRIATAINVRDQNGTRIELRTFGSDLRPHRLASRLPREPRRAAALAAAELDGRSAIVVASNAMPEPLCDDLSGLHVFNISLAAHRRTEWQTFRQSSTRDLTVADLEGNGEPRIITVGTTVMRGSYGYVAQTFGEVRVWDAALRATDLFLWPLEPGARARPSRACLLPGRRPTLFVASCSGAWEEPAPCEITSLRYQPSTERRRVFVDIARAWQSRRVGVFRRLLDARDPALRTLAVEGLATVLRGKSVEAIAPVLGDRDRSLVRRAADIIRAFRSPEAVAAAREAGFATPEEWIVVGPFDNAKGRGFDRAFPPERRFDAKAFYASRDGIARWSKVRRDRPDIYVDLAESALLPFARTGVEIGWNPDRTEAVAYALTDVHSPRRREATIRLGRSDAARVWLNGREIWANGEVRSPAVDDEVIPIILRAGRNRVMLKIANTKTHAWGFYFRIADRAGRPIRGLRYVPPKVAATQGDFLSREELVELLGDRDPALRVLAAAELARTREPAGVAALERLAAGRHRGAAARAALTLAELGERSAADRLAALAPSQSPTFRLEAAHALQRLGDRRWKRFSLERLRGRSGHALGEFKVEPRGERNFRIKAVLQGEDMGSIGVSCGRRFHLGDGVAASCSHIDIFGMSANRFRRRGIGAEIIRRGCEMMDERGDACSVVGTGTGLVAHRLYRRMGYVDRWHGRTFYLGLRQAPAAFAVDKALAVRRCRRADRSALDRLRRAQLDNSVGPADDDRRPAAPREWGPWVWAALREGEVIGYLDVADDPYDRDATAREIAVAPGVDPEPVVRALLAAVVSALRAKRFDQLSWRNPPERMRPLAAALGFARNPWEELHGWVGMFKVIRLGQLLTEISPLLSGRLQRSVSAGWQGRLALRGSRLRATLVIEDGNVRVRGGAARDADVVVTMSDDDITRLVGADCDVWDAYRHHLLSTRPAFNERIWRLLEALFPRMDVRQG